MTNIQQLNSSSTLGTISHLETLIKRFEAQISEYQKLIDTCSAFLHQQERTKSKNVTMMCEISKDVFVKSEIPDTTKVIVHIGNGVWIEYDNSEAIQASKSRITYLSSFLHPLQERLSEEKNRQKLENLKKRYQQ